MNQELKFSCQACGQHIACGVEHAGESLECPTCQTTLVVPTAERSPTPRLEALPSKPLLSRPTPATWKTMGAGLGIAIGVALVSLLNWVFHYLGTMIHELGHWVVMMAFGYPSVPTFHVMRGGVTMTFSRMPLLLCIIYVGWALLLWQNRGHRKALGVLGTLCAIYVLLAHTGLDQVTALTAGHVTQLLVAGVFLYRAWAGASILVPLERPLYAAVGFHLVGVQLVFAWRTLFNSQARDAYVYREDGINDFVRLSTDLGVPMNLFLLIVLLGALAVPALSFLAFRYQARWRKRLANLFQSA